MKQFLALALLALVVWTAACGSRPGDPAEFITVNKQREIQLLGAWELTQLQNGSAPQPDEHRTLIFQYGNQMQMDLGGHRVSFKYEAMPDPDHLRLTWVSSTNPNDKPADVPAQPFTVNGNDLVLNGDRYKRIALVTGATVAPSASNPITPSASTPTPDSSVVQAHLQESFELRGGTSAELIDAPSRLKITFRNLVADTRCTPDVQCVWAGEVRLQITFDEDGLPHPPIFELTTNPNDPNHAVELTALQDYVVELIAVKPPHLSTAPIPLQDYIATFRVTNTTQANFTPQPVPTRTALPTAAATPPNGFPTMKLDESFTLRAFQSVLLSDAQMQVTFNGVLADSRCPRNVNCAQAGHVLAKFMLEREQRPGFFTLSNVPPDGRLRGYFQGYTIELQEVTPYPENIGQKFRPQDYSARIVIRKLEPPPVVPLNEGMVLNPGQSGKLADQNVTLTFERVTKDSRCPYGATCAQQGQADLQVTLQVGDNKIPLTLDTTATVARPTGTPFQDYAVELLELNPYPRVDFASKEIAPGEYVATFALRRYAVTPRTPAPGSAAPAACPGMTAQDAMSILGQPVQSEPVNNVLINVMPFDDVKRAPAVGICGYVSVAKNSDTTLPAREPRIVQPSGIAYAVTASKLSGVAVLEQLRVVDILRSALPDDDGSFYYLAQARFAAGDWSTLLDDLVQYAAKGKELHAEKIDAPGSHAVWLWRPAQSGNYAAVLAQTKTSLVLLEAFTPKNITEAAAKESILHIAPGLIQ